MYHVRTWAFEMIITTVRQHEGKSAALLDYKIDAEIEGRWQGE